MQTFTWCKVIKACIPISTPNKCSFSVFCFTKKALAIPKRCLKQDYVQYFGHMGLWGQNVVFVGELRASDIFLARASGIAGRSDNSWHRKIYFGSKKKTSLHAIRFDVAHRYLELRLRDKTLKLPDGRKVLFFVGKKIRLFRI